MNMHLLLAIISVIVIIALAFYTGILINKIKMQKAYVAAHKKEQVEAIQKRNDSILDSIHLIAKATTQKQCNVSEAAIRLTVLLETLQLKEPIDIATTYPALTAMYEKVKDMPTHEQRKQYPVKEIKVMDLKRELFEAEMEEEIIKESALLAKFSI